MLVYIYKGYISKDDELISEKAFDYLASKADDIAYAENYLDSEWDNNVEIEECTQDEIDNYVKNGYVLLTSVKKEGK